MTTIPSRATTPMRPGARSVRLRIVSWNIHACVGTDRRYDPQRVAEVLADIDADIIGLQEVDWRRDDFEGADQFFHIARALDMMPIEGPTLHDHDGRYGNGLLTRLPVLSASKLDLAHPRREPRGAIDAKLEKQGREIRAMVTHLGLASRERRRQIALIRDAVREKPEGQIRLLMGDMNEWLPRRTAARVLTPDCFESEFGARSFPSFFPLFSLDRIFADPAPSVAEVRADRTAKARLASDHLPIVADLEWG
ncbi:MAG: endonuclease/exonuclease/phosphatase family protein [Phycisphaerales bacterium]|nr:endonuclease/exonuclease/phosphatase family protein [Phycisphaerales bacterium]